MSPIPIHNRSPFCAKNTSGQAHTIESTIFIYTSYFPCHIVIKLHKFCGADCFRSSIVSACDTDTDVPVYLSGIYRLLGMVLGVIWEGSKLFPWKGLYLHIIQMIYRLRDRFWALGIGAMIYISKCSGSFTDCKTIMWYCWWYLGLDMARWELIRIHE